MIDLRDILARGRLYLPPWDFDKFADESDAKVALDENGRRSIVLATAIGAFRVVRDPEPTVELAAIADAFDSARLADEPLHMTAARVVEDRNRYAERLAEINCNGDGGGARPARRGPAMRIESINGNVLTVTGEVTVHVGDRLCSDVHADGSAPNAGSMLVEKIDAAVGLLSDERALITVDSVRAGNAVVWDYLFVTHSQADRERAQAVADALAAPFPGLRVRALDASPGEWATHWSFKS